MRIAVIAHLKHAIQEPFAGGLEAHTHMLASGLRRSGHDVTVFASTKSDPAIGLEAICDETALQGVGTAEAADVGFFREHHAYLRLMTELRRRRFDVIQNNSLHYLPVAMADALRPPTVTTFHTPPFCWLESGVRLCSSERAVFVAVSKAVGALWAPVVPIDRVIPNGIDVDRFAFRPRPAPDPYLAWSGRIVPEKGPHLAIEAARIIGLPIRIAGPLSDPEYFAAEIAPRLDDRAIYLGHLEQTALARMVGGAQVLLFTPRWDEPYGLAAAEALACGTPVATFDRGALREIVDASCGTLAPADDVRALARAADAARGLDRAACRKRAEQHCNLTMMIASYERLYQRLLVDETQPMAGRARASAGHMAVAV